MATNSLENLKKRKRSIIYMKPRDKNPDVNHIIQAVKVRVGSKYQADIPELLSHPVTEIENEEQIKVWFPSENISEVKLNDYILFSKKKHGYNIEQSLGMLYWNEYDVEKAIEDLADFKPCLEWSIEDKSIFENAFNIYGKDFENIQEMLPEKSFKSLVCYYYEWKKKNPMRWSRANKSEHFCANKIQNESSEESNSSKCEPDNEAQHDNQDIGHVHKKLKLNGTNKL